MTQIACHECDLLLDLPNIIDGGRAYCPRCGSCLCVYRQNGLQRTLIFSITASIFLVIANLFPFLTFKAKGHEQVITLFETCLQLYNYGSTFLASFVLMFILIAPAILLFCVIWILTPLVLKDKYVKGSITFGKIIFHTIPWSMHEVFLIGILVSMVKISTVATVTLGASFTGYVGFTIFMTTTLSSLDSHQFWAVIEQAHS